MKSLSLLLALGLMAGPAAAEDLPKVSATPPDKIIQLMVYGNDPCPKSDGSDIVVCARQPEGERYRIPKKLRNKPKPSVANSAWGARSADLEAASRANLPNSCSANGSNGQTGCFQQFISDARAQRAEDKRQDAAEAP